MQKSHLLYLLGFCYFDETGEDFFKNTTIKKECKRYIVNKKEQLKINFTWDSSVDVSTYKIKNRTGRVVETHGYF